MFSGLERTFIIKEPPELFLPDNSVPALIKEKAVCTRTSPLFITGEGKSSTTIWPLFNNTCFIVHKYS
ncbi:hypothetical protein ES705_35121 [subsurface metagenome]